MNEMSGFPQNFLPFNPVRRAEPSPTSPYVPAARIEDEQGLLSTILVG
jgi:hypothetical protein